MNQETVLITGGTSGIGLATAQLLHKRGANVLVTGRNPETIRSARSVLPDEVAIVQADVASLDDTERVIGEVRDRFGSLTGLFLNAGINKAMPFETVDENTYDEVFATNAKGQFFVLQKALPLLADAASVVFTVGIAATRGLAGMSLGAGSKGALLTMLPSLAVELAPRGVRVNAVSPGAISTPIWTKSGMSAEQLTAVTESMAAAIPLRRLGEGPEVAAAVAFLLSDDASYITGENIVIGGGAGLRV
ncbi:SDR family oxidoreductase [Streptomyces brasiliensis]|uniref:Short-chain dehydrogenase n=1 Tax=Streptomyces brasiliensis TaxID=1954 RepID=A0A917LA60_9ACTN|nr:SDR family oxidoreductase [Streptomyces brasiliensis]GGJ48221.1 short-chain dehydrogenase [Streptomyces brasiliensis]